MRIVWFVLIAAVVVAGSLSVRVRPNRLDSDRSPVESTRVKAPAGRPSVRLRDRGDDVDAGFDQSSAAVGGKLDSAPPEAESEAGRMLHRTLELWRRAADHGAPDEALAELRGFMEDADPRVSSLARQAVADLERMRDDRDPALEDDSTYRLAVDVASAPDYGSGREDREASLDGLSERLSRIDQSARGERISAILELWRYAADSGTEAEALQALEARLAVDASPEDVRELHAAMDDLRRRSALAEGHETTSQAAEQSAAEQFTAADSLQRREDLMSAATGFDDADASALALMAARDAADSVRLQGVQALWRLAADGRGDHQAIRDELWLATGDVDRSIRSIANRALADLQALDVPR